MSKLTLWLGIGVLVIVVLWFLFTAWKSYNRFSEMDASIAVPNESLIGESAIQTICKHSTFTNVSSDEEIISNNNAFYWEGGNFNGINAFWSFQCDSNDSCWQVLLSGQSLSRKDFQSFEMPTIEILREGPWDDTVAGRWKLGDIQSGAYYLDLIREGRLFFVAIDFDTNIVYGSYQSGGY